MELGKRNIIGIIIVVALSVLMVFFWSLNIQKKYVTPGMKIDKVAAKNFCSWFADNADYIDYILYYGESEENTNKLLENLSKKLQPVFPYYKEELKLFCGYDLRDGKKVIIILNLESKKTEDLGYEEIALCRDVKKLTKTLPFKIRKTWSIFVFGHDIFYLGDYY